MRWRRHVALAAAAVVLPPLLAAVHQGLASALFGLQHPAPGTVVPVAERGVHVVCEGDGPTVVFVHGLGGSVMNGALLRRRLIDEGFRACAWDRAGYGWSDPSPGAGDLGAAVDDWEALVDAGALPGRPAAWVVHSYGAFVVRSIAAAHPDAVAPAVWLDAAHPAQLSGRCEPSCLPEPMPAWFFWFYDVLPWMARWGPLRPLVTMEAIPLVGPPHDLGETTHTTLLQAAITQKAVETTAAEARTWPREAVEVATVGSWGAPLTVVHAVEPFDAPPEVTPSELATAWAAMQADLATLSSTSPRRVPLPFDHNGLLTRSEAVDRVVAEVDRLVNP